MNQAFHKSCPRTGLSQTTGLSQAFQRACPKGGLVPRGLRLGAAGGLQRRTAREPRGNCEALYKNSEVTAKGMRTNNGGTAGGCRGTARELRGNCKGIAKELITPHQAPQRTHARTHARTHPHTHTYVRTHTHTHTHVLSTHGGTHATLDQRPTAPPGAASNPPGRKTLIWDR